MTRRDFVSGLSPGTRITAATTVLIILSIASAFLLPFSNQTLSKSGALPRPVGPAETGPSGLVAFWQFDEGSGTVAHDSSGNGNNGTLVNSPRWVAGPSGDALSFNGTNYVQVSDSQSLNITGSQFSISAWVNPRAQSPTFGDIVTKRSGTLTQYYLSWWWNSTTKQIGFGTGLYNGTNVFFSAAKYHPLSKWYNVVEVYNGTRLRLFVNDSIEIDQRVTGNLVHLNAPVDIGFAPSFNSYFNGTIDEVQVYSRALTQNEVAQLSAHPTSTIVKCASSTVAVGTSVTCTGTVNDNLSTSGGTTPTGSINFTSTGAGRFSPTICMLATVNATTASCSVMYAPTSAGTGTHRIGASYGGDSTHSLSSTGTPFALSITGFSLKPSPSLLILTVGTSQNATVTLHSFNSFAGNVSLSAFASPAGPSTTLKPTSIILSGNATSTLTVGSRATGSFNVTISGTSGSETEQAVLQAVVTPSATLNSTSLFLPPNGSNSTTMKIATASVGPLIPVAASNLQSGTASISVSSSATSSTSGSGVTLTTSPNSTTTVQGSTSTSTVTVTSTSPNHGGIELSTAVTDPPGLYVVTVTARLNGTIVATANVTVTVQDFIMNPTSPLVIVCTPGATCTTGISSTPINGFSGQLSLTATHPSSLTANLSPSSISVPGSATLSVSAGAVGTYVVTVTGTSGSLSHTTQTITVQVVDFQISASSPSSVNTGSPAVSMITLTALNSFAGTVGLTDMVPSGLSCSAIAPGSLTLPPSPASASLTCTSSSAASYTVTLTATSGAITHSTSVTFTFNVVGGTPGGVAVPIDMLSLLAPYLGLVSTIVAATFLSVIYLKRIRNKKTKAD